jgi:heme/copper-type cytochrome/quinol oxidase subunit 4
MDEKKKKDTRLGLVVLVGLAILTAVEFGASNLEAATIALFVMALFKAGLILQYFMHVSVLWSDEEEH